MRKEKVMPHVATAPGATSRARVATLAAVVVMAFGLAFAGGNARAADKDTTVTIKAFPPSVQVDSGQAKDDPDADSKPGKHATVRFDSDDDFEAISEKMPWVIGLIFLVVGSIFLTPIVLLIGIIWYKLRRARLQNEAMLALAEKGVVPPAQAAEALAAGASPASAAPQVYQQVAAVRKRAVWSDLRKGVILSTIGLALSFYELTSSGGPSWVGLVLLFVGAGYVTLWWLEGRHLDQTRGGGTDAARPGASGS
jgi:hypothetical protein